MSEASAPANGAPVTQVGTVIVASDGSEESTNAIRAAAALFPAESLTLVTVIRAQEDPMADAGGFEGPLMDEHEAHSTYQEDRVAAEAVLAADAQIFGARPVRQDVIEHTGEGVGARLCHLAIERDASIMVVGSHGHGALYDALLGSVSNYVVHHCERPVLVIPAPSRKHGG